MNKELSEIFKNISSYFKQRRIPFKPSAYQRASEAVFSLEEDVEDIYKKGGIKEFINIPGIGKNIALKIEEFIKRGKIEEYERIKKELPEGVFRMSKIEGIGIIKAENLYREIGIKDIKELRKAAKEGKISVLSGFGKKTEKKILEGTFLKKEKGSYLSESLQIAKKIKKELNLKEVEIAGSLRRRKEIVKDIVLVTSDKGAIERFTLKNVSRIISKGKTKFSVRLKEGINVDIRVANKESYPFALQYFTGSREHNISLRKIAISRGLKLNEYGLYKGKKKIACKNEKEIYSYLGLPFIPPELRENSGEFNNAIPKLITIDDIKGDLHIHSSWNGGKDKIIDIVRKAEEMGYQYLGISDHTEFLKVERGLSEKELLMQKKEIDKIKSKIKILHGCECNILDNGSLDMKDSLLRKMDYVIAGVHSSLRMKRKEMTERIIKAMENPFVDIISHPTGRLIKIRKGYDFDFEKILEVAKKTGTILEINSSPYRLDLKDSYIRRAKEKGVKMIINSDAHQKEKMDVMKFGVFQARRGWAEKKDIINSMPLQKMLKLLKRNND